MQRLLLMMSLLLVLAGCGAAVAEDIILPTGDVSRGESLYQTGANGAPACLACHTLDGTSVVGPSLQGFGAIAGTRVEGQSADDYAYFSIVRPANHLVDGFGNLMYTEYQSKLSEQDIADLIAYILTQ